MQYYLPDASAINKDFLRDVLTGKKNLMKKAEVREVAVPKYDELSVVKLYPTFKDDKKFLSFFPDKFPKDKGPPRDYFFNILNTLHPEYLAQIMEHAGKQRFAADGVKQKEQIIEISQFWEEELKAMPYLSCKLFLCLTI